MNEWEEKYKKLEAAILEELPHLCSTNCTNGRNSVIKLGTGWFHTRISGIPYGYCTFGKIRDVLEENRK